MKIGSLAAARARMPQPADERWTEGVFEVEAFARHDLRVSAFAPQGIDHQVAHNQDELYIVGQGSAHFVEDGHPDCEAKAGDLIFVKAGIAHRFTTMSTDFATWVVFFGPLDPKSR